jgi:hypothetical protein
VRAFRIVIAIVAVMLPACSGSDNPSIDRSAPSPFPPALTPYAPSIQPAHFVGTVDNPYFPLEPGTTYRYRGTTEGEVEKDVVTVLEKTKEVMGVTCTVVKDVVSTQGEIAEKTFDWYAQDRDGNVWYFGEDSAEYENGHPASTEGSWEAGVDGALPGIIMLARPATGDRYRQEYAAGEAEDVGRVIDLGGAADVPFGSFDDVWITEDSSLIETNLIEHKYYARGVGVVLERSIKGPSEVVKLVDVSK